MIRKYVTSFMLFAAVFFCITSAHAQMTEVERGNWLLGVVFKLERMRDDAMADIQRYEGEIHKCNATIGKCENIIRLARQKGNAEAERIAGSALAKARQAKLKNDELKNSAVLRKRRAEVALANVHNLLAKQLAVKAEIRSVVTGRTGRATIFSKRLNESINLDDNRAAFLEPGDEIWTYGNSSVEMQFLDGRGTLKLGEYSRFRMEEDKPGTQIINMLKGKIYIGLDKIDDYRKMMQERIERSQKGYDSTSLSWPLSPGFEFRTLVFGGAVRGTKFLVFADETTETELIVLEGTVEVKAIKGDKTFLVDAGYRIRATKDGVISKPEKIDQAKIERWWEK